MVCDAGLPVPRSAQRIDMALTQGVPSFMQVLEVVTAEMQVEAAIIASEIKQLNPQLHETLLTHLEQLQQHQGNTIEVRYVTHEQFKKKRPQVVRRLFAAGSVPRLRISFSVPASPSEAIMDALLQLKGIDKSFPGVKASLARR